MILYVINHYLVSILLLLFIKIINSIFKPSNQLRRILLYCFLIKSILPWGKIGISTNLEKINKISQKATLKIDDLNYTIHDSLPYPYQYDIFLIIFLFLVFVSLILFLLKVLRIMRIVYFSKPLNDEEMFRFVDNLPNRVPLQNKIKILESEDTSTAFVWFNKGWIIVVPENHKNVNFTDKMNVLAHEISHIIKRDLWKYLGLNLLCHCAFFSLFVRYIVSEILLIEEMETDKLAISLFMLKPNHFCQTLVKMIEHQSLENTSIPSYLGAHINSTRKRIQFLYSDYKNNNQCIFLKLVFVGNLLLILLLNLEYSMPSRLLIYNNIDNSSSTHLNNFHYTNPLPDGIVTMAYGQVIHPIKGIVFFHRGIDIAASVGTRIYAPNDGTIIKVAQDNKKGNYLIIGHEDGIATVYTHLDKVILNPDDNVKQGQVIGYVGETGLVTGPHLHFEITDNGTPVDPETFIKFY